MLKLNNKHKLIIIAFLIMCALGSILVYSRYLRPPTAQNSDGINLQPATEEDLRRADENKQRNVERDEKLQNNAATISSKAKRTVKPTITYAGQYGSIVEVGGFVDTYEDGGTCKARFTNGAASVTKEVAAVKDARTVNCPTISAQVTEFVPRGAWSVVLSYSSAQSEGNSDAKQIEVK